MLEAALAGAYPPPLDVVIPIPYPTMRAAGLFLMTAGALFAVGWLDPRRFGLWMALAFGLGGFAAYVGYALPPNLGPIPQAHLWAYGGAVAFEVVGIALVYRLVKAERLQDAWVLMVVGAHFALMAPALGPDVLALAAVCMANAGAALVWRKGPVLPFGLIDSAAKIGFGALFFFTYPVFLF